MKKFLKYMALFAGALTVGLTACGDDETSVSAPSFTMAVGEISASSVELNINSSGVRQVCYICTTEALNEVEQSAVYISNFGTAATIKNEGATTLTVSGLHPETEYTIYLIGLIDNDFYNGGELFTASFTTTGFDEDFVIFDVGQRSVSVHVKVPDSVYPADKNDVDENGNPRNHVIKWGIASLFNYVSNMLGSATDDLMINLHDEVYHNYITEDATIVFDAEHSVVLDKNGEPELDEEGLPTIIYNAPIPGEPSVVLFGEFAYGKDPMNRGGDGYYVPMFDYYRFITEVPTYEGVIADEGSTKYGTAQHPYWGWFDDNGTWHEAFHRNCMVVTAQPEPLDAKVKVEVETTTKGGLITLTPERGVYLYCVSLVDDAVYNEMLACFADAPGNPEDYMQYFVSSYDAMMSSVSSMYMASAGKVRIRLEDMFFVLPPNTKYHLCITAMGDSEGSTQSFIHEQFQLKPPTLPEPQVVVTALGRNSGNPLPDGVEEDPHYAWFNVKKAEGSPDIQEGALVCNTERAFAGALKTYTYLNLAETNYLNNYGSFTYMKEMNSEEGFNLAFPCKPDGTTLLVAYVKNVEGIANTSQLDTHTLLPEGCTAVAMHRSIPVPAGQRVESPLFESLKGDWTATATVTWLSYAQPDENGNWVQVDEPVEMTEELRSKVTIGDMSCPETLDPQYYALYDSKEQADALYAELKRGVDMHNERVRGYNRLFCHGFSFDVQRFVSFNDKLLYASPYDLFISTIYGAYNIDAIFYDFGPKWYIEVDAEGKLSVPFNTNSFSPMTAWYAGDYYLVGIGNTTSLPYMPKPEGKFETAYFPAELSADGNTITVKSLSYGGDTYYPNAAYNNYGSYQLAGKIISDLVLTRGWTEAEQMSVPAAMAGSAATCSMPSAVGQVEMPKYSIKSAYTPLFALEQPVVEVDGKVITRDTFRQIVKANGEKQRAKAASGR